LRAQRKSGRRIEHRSIGLSQHHGSPDGTQVLSTLDISSSRPSWFGDNSGLVRGR
jgi:hypothetical protein